MIENQNIPSLRFQEYTAPLSTSTLKELGRFYYGKSAPKHSLSETAETPCVRYGELYTKFNGVIEEVYSYTEIPKSQLRFSKGDEILIPRVGEDPIGFSDCSWLKLKGIAIGEMISVYETGQIPLYVVLYIRSKLKYKFARMVEGGNVSNLYFRYLEDIKMNYPSLPEQQKIADFLTAVDKRIELLEKKKTLLETYKKGVMKKIFNQEIRFKDNGQDFPDWEERKLRDLISDIIDNRGKTPPVSSEGIPLIEVNAIGNKNIDYSKIKKYVDQKTYDSWFRKHLIDNDVLFSTVGQTAICSLYKEITKSCIAQNLVGLRFKNVDQNFMYYLLTEATNNHKFKRIEMGAVQPSVKVSQMIHLKFSLPNVNEQVKISRFLSSLDNQIELLETQIDKSKTWKKGLLQKMFV